MIDLPGISKKDTELIEKIAKHAYEMTRDGPDHEIFPMLFCMLALAACHKNGSPLRLADMLVANDEDFMLDIYGIRLNSDETGKLRNGFTPIFSISVKDDAKR